MAIREKCSPKKNFFSKLFLFLERAFLRVIWAAQSESDIFSIWGLCTKICQRLPRKCQLLLICRSEKYRYVWKKGTYRLSSTTFRFFFQNFFFRFFCSNRFLASWQVLHYKNFSIWAPLGLATGLQKFSKKIFFS